MVATKLSLFIFLYVSLIFAISIPTDNNNNTDPSLLSPADLINALDVLGVDVNAIPGFLSVINSNGATPASERSTSCPSGGCSLVCYVLSWSTHNLGSCLSNKENTALSYEAFVSGYWSGLQSELQPSCIFEPTSIQAVQAVMILTSRFDCQYSIKSGGHAAFAGSSSINNGITISLKKLNQITMSSDKKSAVLGPGAIWGDVYGYLNSHDVTAIGGRIADIGVGGLTLGGGISYLSGEHGWACDNVLSYTIVLYNGTIFTATYNGTPDQKTVYKALRGGGPNLGIVVEFKVALFPMPGGDMFGGYQFYFNYTNNTFGAVTDAYYNMALNAELDTKTGGWVVLGASDNIPIMGAELYYGAPNGGGAHIYEELNTIYTSLNFTSNIKQVTFARNSQNEQPYGLREVYAVTSFLLDKEMLRLATQIYYDKIGSLNGLKNSTSAGVFQFITKPMLKKMNNYGGNVLGISSSENVIVIMHLSCWWSQKSDDKLVYQTLSDILTTITNLSKQKSLASSFRYMNYATQYQDPTSSYGQDNIDILKAAQKITDNKGIYNKLRPGYFKIGQAALYDANLFQF